MGFVKYLRFTFERARVDITRVLERVSRTSIQQTKLDSSAPEQAGLRVLVIGLNYLPEQTGIAPYTSALARGLAARGVQVDVLSAHPHYPEWKIHPGFGSWTKHDTVDGLPIRRLRHYVPAQPSVVKRLLSEISFGLRVVSARWGNPDVVVLVSPALFASALATLRVRLGWRKPAMNVWLQDIYSLGITETGMGGGVVARIITWVEKNTLNAASGVVVIHRRFADYVSDKLGVEAKRVEVVRNWTHLDAAPVGDQPATRRAHSWAADETVVLHAGNMGVKQGLENVINAARLADEQQVPLRFVLLGNGSQRDELRDSAEGIERLDFIDSLDDAGFQGALSAADILLVNEKPGVSEMAVPSKLTSYFNAGRPVLAATDLSGITAGEIEAAQAGLVVQAGDPQGLVDAALHLRNDSELATALGASALRYRTDVLGETAAIDRYAEWIRSLVAAPDIVGGSS